MLLISTIIIVKWSQVTARPFLKNRKLKIFENVVWFLCWYFFIFPVGHKKETKIYFQTKSTKNRKPQSISSQVLEVLCKNSNNMKKQFPISQVWTYSLPNATMPRMKNKWYPINRPNSRILLKLSTTYLDPTADLTSCVITLNTIARARDRWSPPSPFSSIHYHHQMRSPSERH